MNDKALVQHFGKARRESRVTIAGYEGRYVITDGYVALLLPRDHPVFDSRTAYPELPGEGETRRYPQDGHSSLLESWPAMAEKATLKLTLTPWFYQASADTLVRALQVPNGGLLFVDARFTRLLSDDYFDLKHDYEWLGTGPNGGVVAKRDGQAVALIMPLHLHRDVERLAPRQVEPVTAACPAGVEA